MAMPLVGGAAWVAPGLLLAISRALNNRYFQYVDDMGQAVYSNLADIFRRDAPAVTREQQKVFIEDPSYSVPVAPAQPTQYPDAYAPGVVDDRDTRRLIDLGLFIPGIHEE